MYGEWNPLPVLDAVPFTWLTIKVAMCVGIVTTSALWYFCINRKAGGVTCVWSKDWLVFMLALAGYNQCFKCDLFGKRSRENFLDVLLASLIASLIINTAHSCNLIYIVSGFGCRMYWREQEGKICNGSAVLEFLAERLLHSAVVYLLFALQWELQARLFFSSCGSRFLVIFKWRWESEEQRFSCRSVYSKLECAILDLMGPLCRKNRGVVFIHSPIASNSTDSPHNSVLDVSK